MVTGDNVMCGNYIAKGCGIFESAKDVLLGDVDVITGNVSWTPLVPNGSSADTYNTDQVLQKVMADSDSFQLAMTGSAYNVLQEEGYTSID